MKVRNTNIQLKEKMFDSFCQEIRKQFQYGGKKYAAINPDIPNKEATDFIVDIYPEFTEGNILKYLLRFKTQKREEDLFKIATYCYILWLKYFTGDVRQENMKVSETTRRDK